MPLTNIILNGDFESGYANWSGTDLEINAEANHFIGGSPTDTVSELDGHAGITVMEQTFTIAAPITTDLTFEFELRQSLSEVTENLDGFIVEVISVSDGSVIYTSGDVFPSDNDAATTTTQNFSASVTFPSGGDYILRFTEISLSGSSDTGGVIIDDVAIMVCFVRGTLINTENGVVPIEDLSIDEFVLTENHGLQQIRWIGATMVKATDKFHPVRIKAGALGLGLPKRDLLVSRQHRMVVESAIAERMFGKKKVFIPAIKLTEIPGIYVDETFEEVEYFHILFDQHEIVFAEGAPTESLYTGPEAMKALSTQARAEILSLFPELIDMDYRPKPALPIPKLAEQRCLVARHIKNQKRLLESKRFAHLAPESSTAICDEMANVS